jgi:hypothetical protein
MVSETLGFYTQLTWLVAGEDFIVVIYMLNYIIVIVVLYRYNLVSVC